MADDIDIEAMLEAPYKKDENKLSSANGHEERSKKRKKARAEVVVMNEKEAKVRNGSEVEIEKGKRAKVVKGSEVEAKKGDGAAQGVEIADSEAATEVLTPDQNLTVPSEERLGCLIASN